MATGHSRPGSTRTAGDSEFGTLAIPLTLLCQCLSDETLKAETLNKAVVWCLCQGK